MHKMVDECLVIVTFICLFETRGQLTVKSGLKKNVQILEFMHCILPECTAPLFTRVHCVTNNTMMSHRRAVVLFRVDFSELSKPI